MASERLSTVAHLRGLLEVTSLVHGPDELESAYGMAAMEAEAAFGDGSLYLEKAVSPARQSRSRLELSPAATRSAP